MKMNIEALDAAADALKRDLGTLDDLRPETQNTLANIYYKFHLFSRNPRELEAVMVMRRGNPQLSYMDFMRDSSKITNSYKSAANIIQSIRKTREQNPDIFDFLETEFLDLFKYRIPDVMHKIGLRRAIERRFRKVDEIPDLYEQMRARLKNPAHS